MSARLLVEYKRDTTSRSRTGPGAPELNFVFTVCDIAAKEVSPIWPGQQMTAHWGVPDLAAVAGTSEQIEKAFRDLRIVSFALRLVRRPVERHCYLYRFQPMRNGMIRLPKSLREDRNDCRTDEELSWSVLYSMQRADTRFRQGCEPAR